MQKVQHAPNAIGRKNVKSPVSKIGHAADAKGQIEADGHQGQDNTVN